VLRLPPLGSIQAFVQVARDGSLKSAADSLALSSPALTRRIQALEQFVGTSLFEREHNGISLNSSGEAFLSEVSPLLDALSLAVERASAVDGGMDLRIGVPSLFASQRLMPALPALRARRPDLAIELDTSGNRLGRVSDDLDAAIVIASEIDPAYYSKVIQRGMITPIGSKALKQSIGLATDFADVPVLLHRGMPRAFHEWHEATHPGIEPRSVTWFDAGQLILDAAAEGLGVAFMFESHLASATDPRLVRMSERDAPSEYAYWFACTPAALSRRPVRAFHDWLFDHFRLEAAS
jgi:LysR family glycine cleavage system transcriptional activator